jgi:predicted Zn-dependent protease with MMP-like domain
MNAFDQLRFSVRDLINGVEVGPAHVPMSLLNEFQKDVTDFLRGAGRDVDLAQVTISIELGSLSFVASGLSSATTLWADVGHLSLPNALDLLDSKRAAVLLRWQAGARENPHRSYRLADVSGRSLLLVNSQSSLSRAEDVWVQVEKYLHGKVVDMGGKTKANVHLELETGQTLTIAASHDVLAKDERNRLYRPALLHVTAEENLRTGELRNLRLLAFEAHQPGYDDDEFRRMVERGTEAWRDIGNATEWTETLRGGRV